MPSLFLKWIRAVVFPAVLFGVIPCLIVKVFHGAVLTTGTTPNRSRHNTNLPAHHVVVAVA